MSYYTIEIDGSYYTYSLWCIIGSTIITRYLLPVIRIVAQSSSLYLYYY